MARKPDAPCAGCGLLLWGGRTSLPPGERMCNPCRSSSALSRSADRRCDVGECDRAVFARSLCKSHYVTMRTGGQSCGVADCPKPHLAKGLCRIHYRQMRAALGDAAYVGGGYKRRAKAHGVAYEPLNRMTIFERDDWVCGICAEPVDRAAAFPDPRSPSLDHVIPMSKGGPHVAGNVQCSHLSCNVQKRDRMEVA